MTRLSQLKVGFALAALLAFAWSVRSDDERVRWVAIGLLAVAFLLRFAGPRPQR